MKRLNPRILVLGGCLAFCSVASAIPISITDLDDLPPKNAGDATLAAWLSSVVKDYNTDNGTSYPLPGSLSYKLNNDGTWIGAAPPDLSEYPSFGKGKDILSITLPVDDYDYLVLHWGHGGWQAFYLGSASPGSEETFTFDAPGKYGLSSYAYYNPTTPIGVPDGGATVGLLGLGLCAIWIVQRKLKA
jgi:hypothetical protein